MQTRTLHHYRSTEGVLGPIRSVLQGGPHARADKPEGFWVSDDSHGDGWAAWCESESWGHDRLAKRYEVVVDETQLLVLSSAAELDAFDRKYTDGNEELLRGIDWARVVRSYAGILITPYIWECRFSLRWYYSWDCASGCIWDARAVLAVSLLDCSRT